MVELKRAQRLTAKELAVRLGLSPNAVRHHLKELRSEGVVSYERQPRGIGAPAFAYRLTSAGEALFPRRYEETLTEVLDQVAERAGRAMVIGILEGHFSGLGRRLRNALDGTSPGERVEVVARALTGEGYMAEGVATPSAGTLTEHNCAILAVAERFPEICEAEARFLAEVLGAEVERRTHILNGCSACEYRLRFPAALGAAAGAALPTSEENV